MTASFAIVSCIYIVFVLISGRGGRKPSVLSVVRKCCNDNNQSPYPEMLMKSAEDSYQHLTDSFTCLVEESGKVSVALKSEPRRKNSKSALLEIADAALSLFSVENRSKFEKIEEIYQTMLSQYKEMSFYHDNLADIRAQTRGIGIRDMCSISALVECFSQQLASVTERLKHDENVTLPAIFRDDKWVEKVRSFNPASDENGASLFSAGKQTGGIAGAGMMIAGGALSILEGIEKTQEKNEAYAQAINERLEDIDTLLDASAKLKESGDSMLELEKNLNQIHVIFEDRLNAISEIVSSDPNADVARTNSNMFPVTLDDNEIRIMFKLLEVYDRTNQLVTGKGECDEG